MANVTESADIARRFSNQSCDAENLAQSDSEARPDTVGSSAPAVERIYRHALPVRLGHWVNALCLFILIMSGLQIFDAHPALYWGDRSDREKALRSIRAVRTETGDAGGVTTILGHPFDTTGALGYSDESARVFPAWATIPSAKWLAMGRRWHLFFAWVFVINGLIFGAYGLFSRHFFRDLWPTRRDLRDVGRVLKDHLLHRHPAGEAAKRYTVLQKLAYTGVVFGLGPVIVLTGLAMSPMAVHGHRLVHGPVRGGGPWTTGNSLSDDGSSRERRRPRGCCCSPGATLSPKVGGSPVYLAARKA